MSLERKMNRAIARKNGTGGARRSQPGSIGRNVREINLWEGNDFIGYRAVRRQYHNRKGWR